MTTTIPAAEAETKISELLERVSHGETFAITFDGQERARLVPTAHPTRAEVGAALDEMRRNRKPLNPPGLPRIELRELIDEGRRR